MYLIVRRTHARTHTDGQRCARELIVPALKELEEVSNPRRLDHRKKARGQANGMSRVQLLTTFCVHRKSEMARGTKGAGEATLNGPHAGNMCEIGSLEL
jgi:hypothetical protein